MAEERIGECILVDGRLLKIPKRLVQGLALHGSPSAMIALNRLHARAFTHAIEIVRVDGDFHLVRLPKFTGTLERVKEFVALIEQNQGSASDVPLYGVMVQIMVVRRKPLWRRALPWILCFLGGVGLVIWLAS